MSEVKGEYPKPCEFCGDKIGTRIDLDWHGLGNCVPLDDIEDIRTDGETRKGDR